MGAKQKLNASYFNGAVVIAALVGWVSESGVMFLLVLIVLLCSAVSSRHIR